jgi:hypothetical protein
VFKPLELLLKLNTETVHSFAEHLVSGFLTISKTDMKILSKNSNRWATLLRVLSITATHPQASVYSYELTRLIVSGHPDSPVTADNFGECVDLLLSFSSGVFGSIGQPRASAIKPQLIKPSTPRGSTGTSAPNITASVSSMKNITPALDMALQAVENLSDLHVIIPRLTEQSEATPRRGIEN